MSTNIHIWDNRGTTIAVGQKVACNVSGQVGEGIVRNIAKTKDRYKPFLIEVELTIPVAGLTPGHISKVTNPLNVLVLEEISVCPHCGQTPLT